MSATALPTTPNLLDRAIKGETINLNPRLGTNATLSAFNQKTGMLYLNSWEIFRVMKFVDEKLVIGAGYTGLMAARETALGGRSTLVIDADWFTVKLKLWIASARWPKRL